MCCHPAFMLSCLCVRNEATTGGQFTKLDRPTGLLFYFILGIHIHWCKTLDAFENQHCSTLNMHIQNIFTQLLIFAFWSFLRPFFSPANGVGGGYRNGLVRPFV